jgi:hypothetical protein
VVTENRGNEKEFMKGNQLISNNIKFKVRKTAQGGGMQEASELLGLTLSAATQWL